MNGVYGVNAYDTFKEMEKARGLAAKGRIEPYTPFELEEIRSLLLTYAGRLEKQLKSIIVPEVVTEKNIVSK